MLEDINKEINQVKNEVAQKCIGKQTRRVK